MRAFGYSRDEDVLRLFYTTREQELTGDVEARGRRDVIGTLIAEEVVDPESGEVIAETASELTPEMLNRLRRAGIELVKVFTSNTPGRPGESPLLKNTLRKDPTENEEEALKAIYSLLRPGEPPNMETARVALERIFFNPKRYDLGRVGRYKINQRLGLNIPISHTVLTQEDFIAIIRYLIELNEGRGFVDDIDHLGNRRVRSVGELIANQFSVGLSRMARLVKERMSITTDVDKINIDDLVNARTVSAVIQAFFGSIAAQPVHGPDEPAGRADAQASSFRAWPGRPYARARRLRSARRALLALRPHVPDRDAGRSEHRSDHVAHDLRAHQRSRLHRDALSRREGTAR